MKRQRIRDIRHQEFIDASVRSIYQKGYAAVTMAEIARATDSTAASINYYFGSKENLMGATMRHLMNLLRRATVARLSRAESHYDRLLALIDANFDEQLYTNANCSVWIQFWSHAPYSEPLARLHRINRSRVRSHFRAELRHLVPADRVDTVRLTLQAYMDGVWIQGSQAKQPLDPVRAQEAAHRTLALFLAR